MLTAFVTRPPSSAAATCSATITPARSCASSVEAARCGVSDDVRRLEQRPRVRLLREDVDRGAGEPARTASASTSAASSTSSPRAALISRAPSFIRAIAAASITPRVSSFSGRWSVTKSARASTPSSVSCSTPGLAEAVGRDERVVGDDAHLEPERAACDLLADAAEAEDAERLLGQLDPTPLRALPAAVASAPRAPGGCCGRARRAGRSCARRPRRCSTRARSRPRCRGASPPRRRRCRRPTPARPITLQVACRPRSGRRSASSPSG